jgi:hypothetical protein
MSDLGVQLDRVSLFAFMVRDAHPVFPLYPRTANFSGGRLRVNAVLKRCRILGARGFLTNRQFFDPCARVVDMGAGCDGGDSGLGSDRGTEWRSALAGGGGAGGRDSDAMERRAVDRRGTESGSAEADGHPATSSGSSEWRGA